MLILANLNVSSVIDREPKKSLTSTVLPVPMEARDHFETEIEIQKISLHNPPADPTNMTGCPFRTKLFCKKVSRTVSAVGTTIEEPPVSGAEDVNAATLFCHEMVSPVAGSMK